MNFCPPKPGFTLITKTISISFITYFNTSSDVEGFSETPAFTPKDFICCITLCKWIVDSACTTTISAPAFTKSSMYLSGLSIIR